MSVSKELEHAIERVSQSEARLVAVFEEMLRHAGCEMGDDPAYPGVPRYRTMARELASAVALVGESFSNLARVSVVEPDAPPSKH